MSSFQTLKTEAQEGSLGFVTVPEITYGICCVHTASSEASGMWWQLWHGEVKQLARGHTTQK